MIESKHHKNDFLIERIAFFSDAVFAIAITLMIIEIHPPKIVRGDTAGIVWHKFRELMPEFLGLIVSFMLIAGSWFRHHSLFKYVDNYDFRFMAINMCLLFTIILFPFSTSFLFNNLFEGGISKLQIYFYLGVPFTSNLILYIMFKRVDHKHREHEADVHFRKSLMSQKWMLVAFASAILWIIIVPMSIHYFGYLFLYIGPVMIAINKKKFKTK
ncbi:MAG: TMEM175 family protein [Ferruginibacter sp.]